MSLAVDEFVVDGDDEMRVLDVPAGSSDLVGPESWSRTVWGSTVVRSLGARLFPELFSGDLAVAPDEVREFLRECALIRASSEVVAPRREPGVVDEGYVRQVSERLAKGPRLGRIAAVRYSDGRFSAAR
ncbi:hypothetical protein [Streptomyces mirabilis]|uniref:hypothetical protein n=1 Tax=Streptomyces mirabilis TaxID=68239 RepID=UPI0036E4141F